jgi:hypothetical protein
MLSIQHKIHPNADSLGARGPLFPACANDDPAGRGDGLFHASTPKQMETGLGALKK